MVARRKESYSIKYLYEGKAEKFARVIRELPLSCGKSRCYRPTKVLGNGSAAVVLRATLLGRENSGRQVALKVQKGAYEDGLDEIFIHSKLHHPNIVEFYRAFLVKEDMYLVLQLCEYNSLHTLVRSCGCLSEPNVRAYTIQIAGAVQYMHSQSVMHRDLKLKNIFLDANMSIKIGDFGLAAILPASSERQLSACGTLNYMAPEIFEAPEGAYDKLVDLWSVGVIIYGMLMGSLPFSADDQEITRLKICECDYTWPESEYQWPSNEAKELIASLLVKPHDRLTPNEIVCHPFFRQSLYPGDMYPAFRRDGIPSSVEGSVRDEALRQRYCRLAGIGRDDNDQNWPCVGREECLDPIGDKREGALVTLPFKWPF